jgi:hypothetical protein
VLNLAGGGIFSLAKKNNNISRLDLELLGLFEGVNGVDRADHRANSATVAGIAINHVKGPSEKDRFCGADL